MSPEATKDMVLKAMEFVEQFFHELAEEDKKILPPILKSPGRWVANSSGSTLGLFFVSQDERRRAAQYWNKGLAAFPGFMISEDQRASTMPAAFGVSGKCLYYSSNNTAYNYAFSVTSGSTSTVVNHFHKVREPSSGEELQYHVDVAFVLGIVEGENWNEIEPKLSELLDHTLDVWRKLQ